MADGKDSSGFNYRPQHVPELIFKATDSIEYSANISKVLDDLRGDKNDKSD